MCWGSTSNRKPGGSCGGCVGVAQADENPEEAKIGWIAEQLSERCCEFEDSTGPVIKDKCSGCKCVGPKIRRHMSLKQERADDVVGGSDVMLGLTILLRSVKNAMLAKKEEVEGVDKLAPIVCLKCTDPEIKLSTHIGKERNKLLVNLRFLCKLEHPKIV